MYDHVGGGFHRYSTDAQWLVPHFEKMLYDNALLTLAYLEGYQVTKRDDFAQVAREILRYVERDMTAPEGAFYSATDADSLAPDGHRVEGWFFTWTPAEIEAVLGKERARIINAYYAVTLAGNFAGRTILHTPTPPDVVAADLNLPPEKVHTVIQEAKDLLYHARAKRPPPVRDEKILTAWNGLMISAYAQAALVLRDPHYADQAARAADVVLTKVRKDGRLLRSYTGGQARLEGYLDDYAFLIAGLLDLYEATSNPRWLKEAVTLDKVLEDHYEDKQAGGFFLTSNDHEALLAREKPSYDGAEPSGNSVAACNLLRLAQMTDRKDFREAAGRLLRAFAPRITSSPVTAPQLLAAYEFSLSKPKQIVLVGTNGLEKLLHELNSRFLPNKIVLLVDGETSRKALSAYLPVLETMTEKGGQTTAYVCENYACQLPTADPKKFAELLQ